jgi:diguanylate cyclase (GGDEF)-like protein
MKILLVEDDPSISQALATTLTAHRYTVDTALDGQIALELAVQGEYDIILLDIMLPKLDGLSVCQQLRQQGCQTPILILTAKDANEDIIAGLNAGADDYLIKPCDLAHFLARVRALLRRQGNSKTSPVLTWGNLCLDPTLIQVTYLQRVIILSPKEYSLLELLLRHPQRIFSRSSIINHLWSIDDSPTDAAVTNLIKDLRRKLKSAGMQEELIETVYRLGYRLKAAPKKEKEQTKGEDYQKEKLATIEQVMWDFRASLEKRIDILEAAARSPIHNLSSFQHQQVKEEAHRLAGGLGTFGYARGSDLARAIEHLFIEGDWEEAQQRQFIQLLAELKQEIAKPPIALLPTLKPLILAIADDTLIAQLQQAAPNRGWQVEVVCDRSDVLRRNGNMPSVIFMSVNQAVPDLGLMLLQELKIQFPTTPILILTTQDSLDSRVAVARLGVSRYILHPATIDEIFDAIAQVLPQTTPTDAKVMIVDDDPVALQTLTAVLQPWGLQITTLSQSQHFWQVLTTTVPDVLLLDLEMPTFNGLELCRVVRQDAYYSDLPILVVTAHTDSTSIQQVFAAGADDFIAKPIIGPELVTRTLARIERSRIQRQLLQYQKEHLQTRQLQATIDLLTQAANRHYFDEFLHREWQRLADVLPLSLISYDIDYFKTYNDIYGYPAGDTCLQQVTRVVWDCIKPGRDLVARLGGDEFAIVLPETSLEHALQVAQRIQQAIACLQIPHPSCTHQYITVSLGISGTIPQVNISPQELIAIATQALYAAKARGRNTYCLYPL